MWVEVLRQLKSDLHDKGSRPHNDQEVSNFIPIFYSLLKCTHLVEAAESQAICRRQAAADILKVTLGNCFAEEILFPCKLLLCGRLPEMFYPLKLF